MCIRDSRYTPWFYLYNQKEIDEMDEEDRNRLVLWGGNAVHGASCGLAFADSYNQSLINISSPFSEEEMGERKTELENIDLDMAALEEEKKAFMQDVYKRQK